MIGLCFVDGEDAHLCNEAECVDVRGFVDLGRTFTHSGLCWLSPAVLQQKAPWMSHYQSSPLHNTNIKQHFSHWYFDHTNRHLC